MLKWLKQQLAELDDVPDDVAGDHLPAVIAEAERLAADAGLPDAVAACQIRPGPVGTELARRVLAECLAACPPAEPLSDTLTVAQAAKRVGVAPDTVIGWIKSGQLKASNVGKGQKRGRYRIALCDLDSFMAGRQQEKPASRKPRKRGPSYQRDFT